MEKMYYLWSTSMQGWATHAGNYGTELENAKQFTRSQALARCILHHRKADSTFGLIPVAVDDMAEVVA